MSANVFTIARCEGKLRTKLFHFVELFRKTLQSRVDASFWIRPEYFACFFPKYFKMYSFKYLAQWVYLLVMWTPFVLSIEIKTLGAQRHKSMIFIVPFQQPSISSQNPFFQFHKVKDILNAVRKKNKLFVASHSINMSIVQCIAHFIIQLYNQLQN